MLVWLKPRWNGIWPLGMSSSWGLVPWSEPVSLPLLVPQHQPWQVQPWLFRFWFQPFVWVCRLFSLLSLPHAIHRLVAFMVISMLLGVSTLLGWADGLQWSFSWMPCLVLPLVGEPTSRGSWRALVYSSPRLSVALLIRVRGPILTYCQSWFWCLWRLSSSWILNKFFVWTHS